MARKRGFPLWESHIKKKKKKNDGGNTIEWAALNYNQILTSRQTKFISTKTNKRKVGINAIANRLNTLNNKIPLSWLNLSYVTYKLHCKKEFM